MFTLWLLVFVSSSDTAATRNDPPKGVVSYAETEDFTLTKALPPIKAMTASALTPTNREADKP